MEPFGCLRFDRHFNVVIFSIRLISIIQMHFHSGLELHDIMSLRWVYLPAPYAFESGLFAECASFVAGVACSHEFVEFLGICVIEPYTRTVTAKFIDFVRLRNNDFIPEVGSTRYLKVGDILDVCGKVLLSDDIFLIIVLIWTRRELVLQNHILIIADGLFASVNLTLIPFLVSAKFLIHPFWLR